MTEWAVALNATGREFLIENCNDSGPFCPTVGPDGVLDCPYHLFRTGIDVSPSWPSIISNLLDAERYLNISSPNCWAYPDMSVVGSPAPGIANSCVGGPRLSFSEAQAHFAAWATVSSPLILAHLISDPAEYDTWWPLVSNTELLAVNAAWAGEAGRLAASSAPLLVKATVPHGWSCEVMQNETLPAWTVWSKRLPGGAVAAVALNTLDASMAAANHLPSASVAFSVPVEALGFPAGSTLAVRDLDAHAALPNVTGAWEVSLGPRGHVFYKFTLLAA
jgi:hypothetical protein